MVEAGRAESWWLVRSETCLYCFGHKEGLEKVAGVIKVHHSLWHGGRHVTADQGWGQARQGQFDVTPGNVPNTPTNQLLVALLKDFDRC